MFDAPHINSLRKGINTNAYAFMVAPDYVEDSSVPILECGWKVIEKEFSSLTMTMFVENVLPAVKLSKLLQYIHILHLICIKKYVFKA